MEIGNWSIESPFVVPQLNLLMQQYHECPPQEQGKEGKRNDAGNVEGRDTS